MPTLFEPDKPDKRKRVHPKNEIWDAVLEVFGLTDLSKSSHTRIGKVVRDLKARHATPEQVLTRKKRYQEMWPRMACTPEAVEKFWDDLEVKRKEVTIEAHWQAWEIHQAQHQKPGEPPMTDAEKVKSFQEWIEQKKQIRLEAKP